VHKIGRPKEGSPFLKGTYQSDAGSFASGVYLELDRLGVSSDAVFQDNRKGYGTENGSLSRFEQDSRPCRRARHEGSFEAI